MKRLLSTISVLCILFLIVRTSREYQENSAYTYAFDKMTLPVGKTEAGGLECIRSLYRMRTDREEMGDWYFYSAYTNEVYARRSVYHNEEAVMINYIKHGTGVWVESLYMTDQNEAGEWEMYEFLHEDYCRQLRKHFDTVTDGDDIWFVFDGQWIGAPELFNQGDSYRYDVGNKIEFEYTSDGIEITAEVEGICTSGGWGVNDHPGYKISAQVKHLGNGNWQLSDVHCRTD